MAVFPATAYGARWRASIDALYRRSYRFHTMRVIGPPAFRNLGRGVF
jgi:hypothetical protein